MKRAYVYLISFFSLVIMFSFCYYFSYKTALKHFNESAESKDNNIISMLDADNKDSENLGVQKVDTSRETLVKPSMKYILESYDVTTQKLTQSELNPPEYLIGLNREAVINYITNYMENIPLEDFQKGLVSYELISFSDKEITMRKSYNENIITCKYILLVEAGEVVVYYSDRKTVYDYTKIRADILPEEEQIKLIEGIEVKDQDELFSILENYTS